MTTVTSSTSSFPRQGERTLERRDLAEYGAVRLRDQVFDAVLSLWRRRRDQGWTQKIVAQNIGRDTGWVSRNLRAPGNWTLQTAGELIQALDGEAEIKIAGLDDETETPSNYDAFEGYLPAARDAGVRKTAAIVIPISSLQGIQKIGFNNKTFMTKSMGGSL